MTNQPTIQEVTATKSGPIYFNHWGPHFEGPSGGVVARATHDKALMTKGAAMRKALDLRKIAQDGEAVFLVTVDHRDSDLDRCTYWVCGPLAEDAFDA